MITLAFIKTWLLVVFFTLAALVIEHAAFGWFGWFLLSAPATVALFVLLSIALVHDWWTGSRNGEYRYLIIKDR